ncbi:unnamed protein product [Ostreobium quekettii]|uniref:ETFB lysine methyltransferase n=1 Tax=Ostreobium quekettii TaxID=121088 RepID=A0A8S1J059_9CHLO|nr:unnamed protein product [Ostreobium quekettii]|eukprot:evm.model.scf_226EXC.15 EVM.evm.TU.scf_226EXC.15   scf_226EXC:97273-100654(-)
MAAHFHSQEDAASALHHITRDFPELAVETESIDLSNEDWVQSVKDSYQPMQVANGVWVVPDWCQPPNPQATNIMLYPGLAFGTGDHATTQLCLEQLMNTGLQGKSLIDYGTGSGILAIGALLLGAKKAVGVDADPVAVRAAIQNAELNGVEDKFTVLGCGHSGDDDDPLAEGGLQPRRFDICVANILKGPLLELCERFAGYVKPGGTVIVSGILKEQVLDCTHVRMLPIGRACWQCNI